MLRCSSRWQKYFLAANSSNKRFALQRLLELVLIMLFVS